MRPIKGLGIIGRAFRQRNSVHSAGELAAEFDTRILACVYIKKNSPHI